LADTLPVSITSVDHKLNHLEPEVMAAMVRPTAARLRPVIETSGGAHAPWLPGYRVLLLDGNHLAATQRRLDVLRGCTAGPLPGHSSVRVYALHFESYELLDEQLESDPDLVRSRVLELQAQRPEASTPTVAGR
jgi:hypothetical protein